MKLKKIINGKVTLLCLICVLVLGIFIGVNKSNFPANAYISNQGWYYTTHPEQYANMTSRVSAGTVSEYKWNGSSWDSTTSWSCQAFEVWFKDTSGLTEWTIRIERYIYDAAYWDDEIKYGLFKVIDTSNNSTIAKCNFQSGRKKNDAVQTPFYARGDVKWNQSVTYRIETYFSCRDGSKVKILWTLPTLNLTDKTAPVGKFSGATAMTGKVNTYYGKNVTFTWDNPTNKEAGIYCKVNGEKKQKGIKFQDEGEFKIELFDLAGNSTSYTLFIDKTSPTIYMTGNNGHIESGAYVRSMMLYAEDNISGLKEIRMTSPLGVTTKTSTSSTGLSSNSINGRWEFEAEDNTGNISAAYVFIDTAAPKGIFSGAIGQSDSSLQYAAAGQDAVLKWLVPLEHEAPVKLYINGILTSGKLDGSYYSYIFKQEGRYDIKLVDDSDNIADYIMIVDRTAPLIFMTVKGSSILSGEYVTQLQVTVSDTGGSGFKKLYYEAPDGTVKETTGTSVNISSAAQNGRWRFWAEDGAGNISDWTQSYVYIDTAAPTAEFTGTIKKDGSRVYYALAGQSAALSWSKPAIDEAPINLKVNGEQKNYAAAGDLQLYTFVTSGSFDIELIDLCGNSTSYRLIVDLTPPVITIFYNGGAVQAGAYVLNVQVRTSDVGGSEYKTLYYKAPNGTVNATQKSNITLAPNNQDGRWEFWAEDFAGNISDVLNSYVYIDTTAPENNYLPRYTNNEFTYSPYDALAGVVEVYYKMPGEYTFHKANSLDMTVTAQQENFGEWNFYAVDRVGNVSETVKILMSVVDAFGNAEDIKNSYKVNTWYQVRLPERIFGAEAGVYTFIDADAALAWAIKKETKYRCSKVDNGWVYVNATNESVSQVYTDKAELDAVILKYAKKYVGGRQFMKNGNNNYHVPIDSAGNINYSALTWQQLKLPTYLHDYAALPLFLCSQEYVFNRLQLPYVSGSVNAHTVTALFVADDVRRIDAGRAIGIDFGAAFGLSLIRANALKQGYYLIQETDVCGNVEEYLIYLDLQTSAISGVVEYGDGTYKEILFDEGFIEHYGKTLYFVSLDFRSVADNIDDMLCVRVYNTKKNYQFTQADKLPTLNAEFGAGKWTIEVFDRSLNTLTFEVNIAGSEPGWNYSSLKNQTKCTITFSAGDAGNAITGLKLFKIDADGNYIQLATDDEGVRVDFTELTYTLKNGGKYAAEIQDLYGRTVRTKPIFYMKDLPEGYLSCAEGARTNKNVTFEHPGGNSLIVYRYDSGNKVIVTDYTTEYNNKNDTYRITIAATEESSYEYLLFLHKSDDRSIFVEYGFTIDCIMASIFITDKDGASIGFDSATNKPFSLRWDEAVSVRYWKSTTVGGEMNAEKYSMNALISTDGIYYFVARDSVGNEISFSVQLDTKVSYQIEGEYKIVNGEIVAKNLLVITVLEVTSSFEVDNAEGYTFTNGGAVIRDGRYILRVTDSYDNYLELIIVIDTIPPELELEGVVNGGKTNQSVTVSSDERLFLTDKKGNIIKDIESGCTFTEAGDYYIRAEDVAGNVTLSSFTIDLFVEYTLSVPNGLMTSSNNISLVFSENVELKVTLDNSIIEPGNYKAVGRYVVSATDEVGNTVALEFTVIPNRAQFYELNLPEGVTIGAASLNGSLITLPPGSVIPLNTSGTYIITLMNGEGEFNDAIITIDNIPPTVELRQDKDSVKLLSASKDGCTITVERDGRRIEGKVGSTFDKAGNYTVTITDDLGNTNTLTFTIDYRVNTVGIVLCVVGAVVGLLLFVIILLARRRPKVR